jgi:hypothetical protein
MSENAQQPKALVTVFEDLKTATDVANVLHEQGFPLDKTELVTHNVHEEAPEVETPYSRETTATSLVEGAAKWGSIGAGLGLVGAILTPFPGVGLAMIIMGGLTGGIVGGMAGVEHAVDDDSINLPTLEEYEEIVKRGENLLVVLGTHEEVMRAEDVIKNLPHTRTHIHSVHGHLYHEHPAHQSKE